MSLLSSLFRRSSTDQAAEPAPIPTHMRASTPVRDRDGNFPGAVEFISYLGSQVDLHVRLSPLERVIVQVQNRPEQSLPVIGEQVQIGWSKSTGHVFQS